MEEHIPEKNAILMVINLADEFSTEAKIKADDNGIILIDGLMFASLLVRYGIYDLRQTTICEIYKKRLRFGGVVS